MADDGQNEGDGDARRMVWASDYEVLAQEFTLLHGRPAPPAPPDSALDAEKQAHFDALFAAVHALPAGDERAALCLSGGGIRSATFSLGVLQGLAQQGQLQRFHYLSTVSGGGYIGSWLSAWVARLRPLEDGPCISTETARARVIAALARVGAGQSAEPAPLQRLRAFSSYLSPVRGLSADFLTLLAIYLRNLVLNWLVLVPMIAALLCLPRLHLALLQQRPGPGLLLLVAALALLGVALTIAFMASDLPGPRAPGQAPDLRQPRQSDFFLLATLPLLGAAVLMSWLGAWLSQPAGPQPDWLQWLGDAGNFRRALAWFTLGGIAVHLVGALFGARVLRPWRRAAEGRRRATLLAMLALLLSGGLGGALVCWLLTRLLAQGAALHAQGLGLYATVSVPVLLIVFWVGMTVHVGLARRCSSEDDREWWARAAGSWLGAGGLWLLLGLLVLQLPLWLLALPWLQTAAGPQAAGGIAALLGLLTSAAGYLSKQGPALRQHVQSVAAALGMRLLDLAAALFIVSLLLATGYGLGCVLRQVDAEVAAQSRAADTRLYLQACQQLKADAKLPVQRCADAPVSLAVRAAAHYQASLQHASPGWVLALAGLLAAFSGWGASKAIGTNTFSLHSMYGNRLVRAYLAASRRPYRRRPHWYTGFDADDNLRLADLQPEPAAGGTPPSPRPLLQVVTAALNLVKPSGKRLEWQQRKAAAFTFSPLYCGSPELGYVSSDGYAGGITLGRALTVSGAAASPNMGYHSSALVAFVMTFFNVRLGVWLPNPAPAFEAAWPRSEPGTGMAALWNEALGNASSETPFINLSDGGHFENLGLYEMVRRRCRHIVLVDATGDPDYRWDDLEGAIRKIRIDMGIEIHFDQGLPGPADATQGARHVATGRIAYACADAGARDGFIHLIKPVVGEQLPLDLRSYAAATAGNKRKPGFPQQSTADQFFDETQFESYRMLGLYSVRQGFPDQGRWPLAGPAPGLPATPPSGPAALPTNAAAGLVGRP